MEAAIILEGCKELDEKNNIRINELIADGDSSVYYNLVS